MATLGELTFLRFGNAGFVIHLFHFLLNLLHSATLECLIFFLFDWFIHFWNHIWQRCRCSHFSCLAMLDLLCICFIFLYQFGNAGMFNIPPIWLIYSFFKSHLATLEVFTFLLSGNTGIFNIRLIWQRWNVWRRRWRHCAALPHWIKSRNRIRLNFFFQSAALPHSI